MSHKKLRPFIVKVSVIGYFPLYAHSGSNAAITTLIKLGFNSS